MTSCEAEHLNIFKKNKILHVFNKNIKNILSNFNPHEIGSCNDKYTP